MQQKRREERLLQRPKQEPGTLKSTEDTGEGHIVIIGKTVDLQNGQQVQNSAEMQPTDGTDENQNVVNQGEEASGNEEENKENKGDSMNAESTSARSGTNSQPGSARNARPESSQKNKKDGTDCTCGFEETQKMREQFTRKRKPRPKSSASPTRAAQKKSDEAQLQSRMSYDEWLKKKRAEDKEAKLKEKQKREEKAAQSDPEADKIVSEVESRQVF